MPEPRVGQAELDVRLEDPAVLEEIELYSELMIVAGSSQQRLTRAQIDQILGVHGVGVADTV